MVIQSPYRRGADDGLWFGLYLTVMFFSSMFSERAAILSLLSLVLVVCVPAVIYFFMRAYDRRLGSAGTFPMLWMHGVVIFFCGMLIAGVALVVYMKWIEPDFLIGQIRSVAALKGALPGTGVETAAEVAGNMLEANFIPTPIDIVVELMMLAIFTGSLLSMILSGVFAVRRRRRIYG